MIGGLRGMTSYNYNYRKKLKGLARALKKHSTKAEIHLWCEVLRIKKFYGYSFLRQRPIGNYIVDFFCKELNLAIEVDGITHEEKFNEDKQKDQYLKKTGISIIRFTDDEVLHDLENVISTLEHFIHR